MDLQMKVGMGQIAQVMSVSESALRKKVRTVKKNLLAYAPLLPFKSNINQSNVSSYARTLIRITMLPRSTPETAGITQGEDDAVPKQIMAVAHAGGIRDTTKDGNINVETITSKEKIDGDKSILKPRVSLHAGKQETLVRKTSQLKEPGSVEMEPLGPGDDESFQADLEAMHEIDEMQMNECISDSELDQYIRSPEEVRLYEQLYDAQNIS